MLISFISTRGLRFRSSLWDQCLKLVQILKMDEYGCPHPRVLSKSFGRLRAICMWRLDRMNGMRFVKFDSTSFDGTGVSLVFSKLELYYEISTPAPLWRPNWLQWKEKRLVNVLSSKLTKSCIEADFWKEMLSLQYVSSFTKIYADFPFRNPVWKPREALLRSVIRAKNNPPAKRQASRSNAARPGRNRWQMHLSKFTRFANVAHLIDKMLTVVGQNALKRFFVNIPQYQAKRQNILLQLRGTSSLFVEH